jgi:hypothetical protein
MAKRKRRVKMAVTLADPVDRVRRVVGEAERMKRGSATVERIMRAGTEALEVTPAGIQRISQAPLDRLWRAGIITTREFEAGDRFRATAYLAAIDPGTMGVDWGAAGGGGRSARVPSMFTAQHIADARLDFRAAEKAIRGIVWRVLKLGLVDELALVEIGETVFARRDRREAAVAGSAGFQVALGACADYFGM